MRNTFAGVERLRAARAPAAEDSDCIGCAYVRDLFSGPLNRVLTALEHVRWSGMMLIEVALALEA